MFTKDGTTVHNRDDEEWNVMQESNTVKHNNECKICTMSGWNRNTKNGRTVVRLDSTVVLVSVEHRSKNGMKEQLWKTYEVEWI